MVADLDAGRATHRCFTGDLPGLQRGQADKSFEGRARRIGRTESARVKRRGGILVQFVENFRAYDGNEGVRIEGGTRGHAEHLPVVGIDDHDGAPAPRGGQRILAGFLHLQIQGSNDIVSRDRFANHPLDGAFALGVECEVENAWSAAQFVVENFLQSFASFRIGKDKVAVFDRLDRKRRLTSDVTDDVAGQRVEWVMAHIAWLQNKAGAETATDGRNFFRRQILREEQRQDTPVLVVLDDGLVGHVEFAS